MDFFIEFIRTSPVLDANDVGQPGIGRHEYQMRIEKVAFHGGMREHLVIDWDLEWRVDLRALHERELEPALHHRVGNRLRQMLERADWRRYEADILDATADDAVSLTVCSNSPEVFLLPWELLTVQPTNQRLGEFANVHIAYAWLGTTTVSRQVPVNGRILLAHSNAGGEVYAHEHSFALHTATAGRADIVHLPDMSTRSLDEALRLAADQKRPYSILHIVCHGGANSDKSGYELLWHSHLDDHLDPTAMPVDDTGRLAPQRVSADRVRQILAPYRRELCLVVVCACNSANPGVFGGRPGSIVQALHRTGIPWVIGSRYPLFTVASLEFTRELYRGLARQDALVDHAFTAARQKLAVNATHHDWRSMQLYARHTDRGQSLSLARQPAHVVLLGALEHPLACAVTEHLTRSGHMVESLDRPRADEDWNRSVERALGDAHVVIVFLSEDAAYGEMLEAQLVRAHDMATSRAQASRGLLQQPELLPVRVAWRAPFTGALRDILHPIPWALWDGDDDTTRVLAEITAAMDGTPLPVSTPEAKQEVVAARLPVAHSPVPPPMPAAQLELPEGTMAVDSRFYVERPVDRGTLEVIARLGGVTITIKGPRQMGKSSLLIRLMDAAGAMRKHVVFLDFQLFESSTLADANLFYPRFCTWITQELGLDDQVEKSFRGRMGNPQKCTRYMHGHVLARLDAPLVLAMDEVESIIDTEFRTDFFAMLRSWHNLRATAPAWKTLDLVLVTSTEPYHLVANLNQSPFNVGDIVELDDFSLVQVRDLNHRHGQPFDDSRLLELFELVAGHPYLIRRALYLVASGRLSVDELFARAIDEHGPFSDHLRYLLYRMCEQRDLVAHFQCVLEQHRCDDERAFFRLRGLGLVRRTNNGAVVPRCLLYGRWFRERLRG